MINSVFPKIIFTAFLCLLFIRLQAACPINETDFANGGTFSGPCTLNYGSSTTITGAVIWTGGTLTLRRMDGAGLIIANGGSLTIQGGTVTIDDDDGGNDGFISVEAGGTLTMTGGTLNIEEDLNVAGTVNIQSGATVNTTQNGDINVSSGGILNISGTLNSNDQFNVLTGGTATVGSTGIVNVNNRTTIQGSLTVSGAFNANGTGGDDLEINGGYVTVTSGGTIDAADDIDITNAGTLEIQLGGTVNSVDDLRNNGSQGTIIVDGILDVGGSVNILNSTPDSSLSGSGTLDIAIVDTAGTFTDQEFGPFSNCTSFPCSPNLIVQILGAPSSVKNTTAFTVTIEFGQNVTGFAIGDITVVNGSKSNFIAVDGNTYTVDITPNPGVSITIDVASNVVNENNYAAVQITVIYGLSPGDVMLLGYGSQSELSTAGDGIAFVTLVDLPAGQVLYFTDNEWDTAGGTWTGVGGQDAFYSWTNDSGSALPAGSIIVIYGDGAGGFVTDDTGTSTQIGGGTPSLRNQDEVLYLYTANSSNDPASTIFLNALATNGFNAGNGDLPSTLTNGTTAIEFTGNQDLLVYNGPNSCNGTLVDCQQQISNTANWLSEEPFATGSGIEWPPASVPVDPATDFSGSALPVVWLSFDGKYKANERMVHLYWVTASEDNNHGFYIERSIDGENFEQVGFVEGHGSTSDEYSYSFVDGTINVSCYYRLRQIDYDGRFEYSKWIYVNIIDSSDEKALYIYPNPTATHFRLGGEVNEIYDIMVTNLSGKIIISLSDTNLTQAEEPINQALSSYPKGIYILKFQNPALVKTLSLIKQ